MPKTDDDVKEAPRRGLGLFEIAGTEIRLDYSWLIIFGLVFVSLSAGYFPQILPGQSTVGYWLAGLVGTLLFFASLLAHELSQAAVARRSGIQVPAITLFLFGGVAEMEQTAHDPRTEMRIAAVGPLTSFALAALFGGIGWALPADSASLGAEIVHYLAFVNMALGVFNLLPGYPLDGGRMLRAFVWSRSGSLRRATRVSSDAGKGLAWGLMILGGLQILFTPALAGGIWLILIGMFLRGMAEAGYQNHVLLQTLDDAVVADVATGGAIVTAAPDTTVREIVDDYVVAHGYRSFPVVEGDTVMGQISLEEIKDVPPDKRELVSVRERMIPLSDALRVSPHAPLTEALRQLARAPGGRLLVLGDDDQLVGLLTKGALARFVEIRKVLEES